MSFLKFNKKSEKQSALEDKTGIILRIEPAITEKNNKLFFCLTNALIMFLMFEGMIGTILKGFEIPVNMYAFTVCNFLICLFYSFFYYNIIIKVIGYIAVVFGFAYLISNYGIIVRSGFGAVTNIFMECIEDALDLPVQREYTEYFKDRYVSVTLCMIAMVLAFGLLFNIVISEVKGSAFVVLMTFPIVQLPLYFDKSINVYYFAMYLMSLIVLFILRSTKHYKLETNKKKGYSHRFKKNSRVYDYVTDGKTSMKMLVSFVAYVLIVTLVLGLLVPQKSFSMNTKYDDMKDDTEEIARKMAVVGLYGMLFEGSSGGVSRNRLGDSKYVKFDFEPDLYVTIPDGDNVSDIYLKGFVGSVYEDNSWKIKSEMDNYLPLTDIGYEKSLITERFLSRSIMNGYDIPYIKLKVSNVGANPNYIYTGYYQLGNNELYSDMSQEDNPVGKFEIGTSITSVSTYWNPFISYSEAKEFANDLYEQKHEVYGSLYKDESDYRSYVYRNYLQVPDENIEVIDKIIKDNDLDKTDDAVMAVTKYLYANYEYSLIPGKTPKGEDFVNYFLTENKKGYCSYFASAAVLMLRRMGIPARYVGGYHISKSDISGGEVLENEDITSYLTGTDEGDVKEVEVNDSSAHAWVEVYVDKLGFIPVDVTPPSDEDESEEIEKEQNKSAIAKMVNAIFNPKNVQTVKNTTFMVVIMAVIAGIVFVLLYFAASYFVTKARKKKFKNSYGSADVIFRMNKYLFKMFEAVKCKHQVGETFCEYGKRMSRFGYCDEKEIEELVRIYEKAKYSNNQIDKSEFEMYYNTLYNIRNRMYESLKWYGKIIFRYVKML